MNDGVAREPTRENSSPSAERKGVDSGAAGLLRLVLPVLAALGGALLIAADFATLVDIQVITVSRERVSGGEAHAYGLALLGALAIVMAFGAARGARPAQVALVVVGVVALAIVLLADVPDLNSTGLIGSLYEEATARPGLGFYLESLGAVLLLISAVALVALDPRR